MKILKFQAENIKGIKAVEIVPDGEIVTLSGPNGSGKSSILDTIESLLCGGDLPIKNGASKARAEIDLGEYIVTRVKTEKTDVLKVKNKDGAQYSSPREFLSKFIGQLSIDPLAFIRLKEKDQLDIIFKMNPDLKTGLEKKESEIVKIKEERSFIARDGQKLKFEIEKMIFDEKLPEDPIEMKDLFEERESALLHNETIKAKQAEKDSFEDQLTEEKCTQKENEDEISKLKDRIKKLETSVESNKLNINGFRNQIDSIQKELENLKPIDLTEIETKIKTLSTTNEAIKKNKDYKSKVEAKEKLAVEYTAKGKEIDDIEKAKTDLLSASKMPLKGLSVLNGVLVYNGVQVSSLSTAEKVRVGASMAVSQNPKAKIILVDDASLLDKDNLKILHDICAGFQIWQVVNDTSGDVGIYIEAGEVKNV